MSTNKDIFINKDIFTNKNISINKATYKHVILLLKYAIFYTSSKPAFISRDIVFHLLLA
jgi:hypothetical protein